MKNKTRAIYVGPERLDASSNAIRYGVTGWAKDDKFWADGDTSKLPWSVGWDDLYYPRS
jgi:hypothetical protein